MFNLETLWDWNVDIPAAGWANTNTEVDVFEYMDVTPAWQPTQAPAPVQAPVVVAEWNDEDKTTESIIAEADRLINELKWVQPEVGKETPKADVQKVANDLSTAIDESKDKIEEVVKEATGKDIDFDTFDFTQYFESEEFSQLNANAKKMIKHLVEDNKKIVNMFNIFQEELENSNNELENIKSKTWDTDLLNKQLEKITTDYVDLQSKNKILEKQKAPEWMKQLAEYANSFMASKSDSDRENLVKATNQYFKSIGLDAEITLPITATDALSEVGWGTFNVNDKSPTLPTGYF